MYDYPFLASVIVPVYNTQKYLKACISSLIAQTIDFSKVEVLLINDGSTDSSAEICQSYAEKYENIKFFSKENEGLSKTRNFGIKKARGKYIFYLDSDDTLKKDTIKEVTAFFDKFYDETDLVTYKIIQYFEGKPSIVHYRYMTLLKSGVYDLKAGENRFITQTNINICVKNMGENNILFDTQPDFRHEDEKYACDVLFRKMKIGYCDKGEYVYNRNNAESIVSTQFSPENIFESSMRFYEELFGKFSHRVPPYYQGIVFNDFRWKLKDKKFLPAHLDGEEWISANKRIDALLKRIDEDTIVLHPSVSKEHMNYWLKRKPDSFPTVISEPERIYICSGGRKIYSESFIKAKIFKTEDGKNQVRLVSPIFFHINKSQIKIIYKNEEILFDYCDNYFMNKNDDLSGLMPSFVTENPDTERIKVYINGNIYPVRKQVSV